MTHVFLDGLGPKKGLSPVREEHDAAQNGGILGIGIQGDGAMENALVRCGAKQGITGPKVDCVDHANQPVKPKEVDFIATLLANEDSLRYIYVLAQAR